MNKADDVSTPAQTLPERILRLLRCPATGERLVAGDRGVASTSGSHSYRFDENGVLCFAEKLCSPEARIQRDHYDAISSAYIENLGYPHTQEYMAYLDGVLNAVVDAEPIGVAAEICCGAGEAFQLYRQGISCGVGVDISTQMLAVAKRKLAESQLYFVQGDATMMPLESGSFDTVFMLGGIHHVNDRQKLFSEVKRILKPGGRFIWREPVSDFWLWRLLRAIIYRVSPILDHATERPLLYSETVPVLERVGLKPETWRTVGFLGFCLFMNSDVLYFNRLFRFIPGIRLMTRVFIAFDDFICRFPGWTRSGLIVVGCARKPA